MGLWKSCCMILRAANDRNSKGKLIRKYTDKANVVKFFLATLHAAREQMQLTSPSCFIKCIKRKSCLVNQLNNYIKQVYSCQRGILFFLPTSGQAFGKSTSHIQANIPHPTSRTPHIPNIPHPQYLTSPTFHIPNIPHTQHHTSPTCNTHNIPHNSNFIMTFNKFPNTCEGAFKYSFNNNRI